MLNGANLTGNWSCAIANLRLIISLTAHDNTHHILHIKYMHPFHSISHINDICLDRFINITKPIIIRYLTFDIAFRLKASLAFRLSQLLLKAEKGLHHATFAILCTITDTLFDLYKPLANQLKRSLSLISIGGLSANNATITL